MRDRKGYPLLVGDVVRVTCSLIPHVLLGSYKGNYRVRPSNKMGGGAFSVPQHDIEFRDRPNRGD